MRILWASNAPWSPTGYGTQTRQMLKRLLADGHEVAVAANHGLQGHSMPDPETGALILPGAADAYGNDVLLGQYLFHQADWLITLYDTWVFKRELLGGARIASWAPIDHYPVPPQVADWCRNNTTIAMSQFGQRALQERGIESFYAPHALELDVWKPTPTMPDGRTAREAWGVPDDAFVVMINAANKGNFPPRKSWGEMFAALRMFFDKHPDAYAYIHTDIPGRYSGVNLEVLAQSLNFEQHRLKFPDQFGYNTGLYENSHLAAYYTAADVLLSTSMGEGFGLATIEAQACGTPVIVTDFTAQPELVGAGWKVAFQPWWDQAHGAYFAVPMVEHIVVRLEEAYEARGDEKLKAAAIAFAAGYDADKVYAEHWRPILARLEEMLKPPVRKQNPTIRANPKKRRKAA